VNAESREMCEERDTWRVCHWGEEQGVKAVMGLKRCPEGKETREVRPWPEAWVVYSRRFWRLLAVTGKAGSAWSDVVFVEDVILIFGFLTESSGVARFEM
jgi:hypothetical protein